MALLWRNEPRLNAFLASQADSIELSSTDVTRLASTFTQRIGSNGSHLYATMGGIVPSPVDAFDGDCAGWLDLTEFNPAVFTICSTVTLAAYNPAIDTSGPNNPAVLQPHLTVGNHAALLANKVHLP